MKPLALVVLSFALAACGQSGQSAGGNDSSSSAAAAAAAVLEPGLWETRVEILKVEVLPVETAEGTFTPELVRHSPPTTSQSCLTPQMAAESFRRFMVGGTASDCDRGGFAMSNGRIGGSFSCKGMDEQTTYRVEGRYTSTSYDATSKAEVRASGRPPPTPMMPTVTPLDMTSRVTGRRIGDCPAGGQGNAS